MTNQNPIIAMYSLDTIDNAVNALCGAPEYESELMGQKQEVET